MCVFVSSGELKQKMLILIDGFQKSSSYHKGEAVHLGYLVATGHLHRVSRWRKVPDKHGGTLDLSPPKHNPPKTTHRAGIIPRSHPVFILIQ